ncbi:MAG: DNA polymerase III subunit gamma/tau [Pyrinomonadaceae bacterium]
MSYQVIARKWRPQTFEEVTGQEVIMQTLRNALEYDRLHHAYLFSGARGVGKTTTARILAKALNCHKTDKPTLTPCLLTDPRACSSCIEISESRSMDVLEIDAASHTGIDDVRGSIIDNINFNPARDRYKVFIIDEVHQLSKPAFNALLKTLEEPPGNVVFVMATTELHKVPETILSRCQEFEFRTIPLQKIFDRLKLIAEAEKISITDDGLRELARSGEGSMRDAQSNFDQVISFSGESISPEDVTNALGFAGVEILSKTINAISTRDPKAVFAIVDDLIARGHDLRNFCRDLLGLFRDLLVFKVAGEDKQLLESAVLGDDEMRRMAADLTDADLMRFFNSMCETETSLREAMHPRYVLEIGLVKLIEMGKVASIESILERLQALTSVAPAASAPEKGSAAAASSAQAEEKKTLKSRTPPPVADPAPIVEVPTPAQTPKAEPARPEPPKAEPAAFADEPPDGLIGISEPFTEAPAAEIPVPKRVEAMPPVRQFKASDSIPVRLPALTADELEHFDMDRLDNDYEERLFRDGDDLGPIKGIEDLVDAWLGAGRGTSQTTPANGSNGGGRSSAAAKPAFDVETFKREIYAEEEPVQMPVLGPEPSRDELLQFANAHPSVRSAMRVFRAKIVEVDKK